MEYRYTDGRLIELAQVMLTHFGNHEARFTAFDPQMTVDWVEPIMQQARQTTLDDFEQGKVSGNSLARKKALRDCHERFYQLCYFVEKAFAERQYQLEQFDLETFRTVRSNSMKALRYLQYFLEQVHAQEAALREVGMSTPVMQALEESVQRLDDYLNKTKKSKSNRRGHTAERVASLNKLYLALRGIEKVAGFVFKDNKHLAHFKLPP